MGAIVGAFFLTFLLGHLSPVLPSAERCRVYGGVVSLLFVYRSKGLTAFLDRVRHSANGAGKTWRRITPSRSPFSATATSSVNVRSQRTLSQLAQCRVEP